VNLKLAFSTLGCPGWSLEKAASEAVRIGYDGLELRLLDGEVVEADLAPAQRERVGAILRESGLGLSSVDSSIRLLADREADDIEAEIRKFLALAKGWSAPMIRVFGGDPAAGSSLDEGLDRAAAILNHVAPAAEGQGVKIAIETHDAFSSAAAVAPILERVPSAGVGVIWDIFHTHRMGEAPALVWDLIGPRVVSVHVKDARREPDRWQLVMLGEGEVPVREGLAVLNSAGYSGWLVQEWEKKWHPEIEEPEVALPHDRDVLGRWLAEEAAVR
jgi:fatty-acyl-CoA synthase